jgi:hypothetical protein
MSLYHVTRLCTERKIKTAICYLLFYLLGVLIILPTVMWKNYVLLVSRILFSYKWHHHFILHNNGTYINAAYTKKET